MVGLFRILLIISRFWKRQFRCCCKRPMCQDLKLIDYERGVKMPTFFGYMIWSVGILGPVFLVMDLVFVA